MATKGAPFPSLVPDFDYGGYYQDELNPWLSANGLFEKWCEAAMGSTVGIINNRVVIYRVDIESFLSGRRFFD